MRLAQTSATVVVALAVVMLVGPALAQRAAPLAVGDQAPDIALGDQHGQPFRLSAERGRRDFVVLAFYVKAFTGG